MRERTIGSLLRRVIVPQIDRRGVGTEIDLNIDDTTCSRCGKHVAWAGYFKDVSASHTLGTVIHWAHNWLIAAAAIFLLVTELNITWKLTLYMVVGYDLQRDFSGRGMPMLGYRT